MSNNYTQFCFAFKVESDEGVNWLNEVAELISTIDFDQALEKFEEYKEETPETLLKAEEYDAIVKQEHFGFSFEDDGLGTAVFTAEDTDADIEAMTLVLQLYLKRYAATSVIGFEWVSTSSPAKIGEMYGGAVAVSASSVLHSTTQHELERMECDLKKSVELEHE